MDEFYVRRSMNGKTFVACPEPAMTAAQGKKCPFTGDKFEESTKKVTRGNAEIMGVNFEEVAAALNSESAFFGKFRINLGETMIIAD